MNSMDDLKNEYHKTYASVSDIYTSDGIIYIVSRSFLNLDMVLLSSIYVCHIYSWVKLFTSSLIYIS